MNIENLKTWITTNVCYSRGLICKKCNEDWFMKYGHGSVWNEIHNCTKFLDGINPTFPQRIWHILNDISVIKCANPVCNNYPTFFSYIKGYLETCSNRCSQLNPNTINKIKKSNLEKYGVEYGASNKTVIEKRKATCFKNYGVDNPTKSKIILDKIAKNNMEKYGVDWILRDQNKKELAVFEKYGVKNVQQSDVIKYQTSVTRKSAFYDSLFNTDRLQNKVIPLFSKDDYLKNGYLSSFKFKCVKCNEEFYDCLEDGDIPRCKTCYNQSSIFEEEVFNFIKLFIDKVDRNVKTVIPPFELDIFIPLLNIAIECNGLYWHGEINGNKNKNYHLNKTLECEKQNIKLIHIFEDEWLFKQDIVKSRICALLHKTNFKIYARKCKILSISSAQCNTFLETNHIQGSDNSLLKYGLFFNKELVSVMTFGKLRISLGSCNVDNNWELYRFCSKLNSSVMGGASKLLKHFIDLHKPTKIVSYADRRWSIGNLYEKIGFVKVSDGIPNYWYFGRGNNYKRHHRYGFAKHTLSKKLETFDTMLSEWENMKINGWDRIWDCGSMKYEWNIKM